MGAVQALHGWSGREDGGAELLSSVLSALRVLAIHDEIVQTMTAVGVLDTARKALDHYDQSDHATNALMTATMGLLRNLCANDEIKTTLCLGSSGGSPSVVPAMLTVAQGSLKEALLQEHVCGTVAAMALRKPKNAGQLIELGAPAAVLTAMKQHPKNVVLQRQGCLAIRNLASRLSEEGSKEQMRELGAEEVLRQAGTHQSCVDEAYAALRDLGCRATRATIHEDGTVSTRPAMFGEVQSNFRAEYD